MGDDALWDKAEGALRSALDRIGLPWELNAGHGAFYGPKIYFVVTDSLGRKWQTCTIQLDYAAPERFDLTYVGDDNHEHRPVVIHRAIYGSFERFIAILIEHFAGAFPVWLAPEQVRVLPISDDLAPVAQEVVNRMRAAGIRAHLDARSDTLSEPYETIPGERLSERLGRLEEGSGGLLRDREPLRDTLARFEAVCLRRALERHAGRRAETAKNLGLTREGLYKKMKRYGIE